MPIDMLLNYLELPSAISDHGDWCCRVARRWFLGMDAAFAIDRGGQVPPAWLLARFRWGPSPWPIHWCELPERETLDCGGLAALTTVLMCARGLEATSAQVIHEYDEKIVESWEALWHASGIVPRWIRGNFAYHECSAILLTRGLGLWNPSENRWIEPVPGCLTSGKLVAVRIPTGPHPWSGPLDLGGISLIAGRWTIVDNEVAVNPRSAGGGHDHLTGETPRVWQR